MDQLTRHTAIYAAGRAGAGLLYLGAIALLTRLAGEDGYGRFTLVFSATLVASTVASGWLAQAILREAPAETADREGLGHDANRLTAWALLAAVLLSVPPVLALSHATWLTAVAAALLGPLLCWATLRTTALQAVLRPPASVAFEFVRLALFAAAIGAVGLLIAERPVQIDSMLLATAAGYAVLVGGTSGFAFFRPWPRGRGAGSAERRERMLRFGIPMGLWLGGAMLLAHLDRYIIAATHDDATVGAYSAVYDMITRLVSVVQAPVLIALHPLFMARGDLKVWQRSMAWSLGLIPVITFGAWLGAPLLASLLDIPEEPVRSLIVPLVVGAGLWNVAMLGHKPLERAGMTSPMLRWLGIALAVNALGNVALVPSFGPVAAAWTTAGASLVYLMGVVQR